MTSLQRREQLIQVGRSLFASKGFEAVSVEEIAASAKVSKPIVYEHFGGKEGLYAVVVDREMRALTSALTSALTEPSAHPRQIVERTAMALLTYIEENAEGFQVLVRDSPSTDPAGSFSSLLGEVSLMVEELLVASFKRLKLPVKNAPYYAQMLVGMTVYTGQYWADQRKLGKEQLAALIVNLAWNGLSRLDAKPTLRFEGAKAKRAAEQAADSRRGGQSAPAQITASPEPMPPEPASSADATGATGGADSARSAVSAESSASQTSTASATSDAASAQSAASTASGESADVGTSTASEDGDAVADTPQS